MIIPTRQDIQIDHIQIYAHEIEITGNEVKIPQSRLQAKIKDIKDLHYGNTQLIKDGEVKLTCTKNCSNCPMHKRINFEVYITSHSFRNVEGHKCCNRNVYDDDIEHLPFSRQKSKWKIELYKQYEGINEKFKYRRTPYITEKSIEEIVQDIRDCMTPSVDGDLIDEYGHERLELECIELRQNAYGYEVYHHGRMGDYGWSSTIRLHRNCDMDAVESALRKKFRTTFKNKI